jgi:hypothetical protein
MKNNISSDIDHDATRHSLDRSEIGPLIVSSQIMGHIRLYRQIQGSIVSLEQQLGSVIRQFSHSSQGCTSIKRAVLGSLSRTVENS